MDVGRGAIAYAGVLQLDAAAAAFAVDEDVLRLDVAMDHPASCWNAKKEPKSGNYKIPPATVEKADRGQQLLHDAANVRLGQMTAAHHESLQVAAREVEHDVQLADSLKCASKRNSVQLRTQPSASRT